LTAQLFFRYADIMTASDDPNQTPPAVRIAAAKCVRCRAPVAPRTRPFCSQRCADLDLGSWLNESYRVPGEERPADPEEGGADEEA
jgi:endogenous inhibitor of DNA gyrase (YacG/DUF329 family)